VCGFVCVLLLAKMNNLLDWFLYLYFEVVDWALIILPLAKLHHIQT